MLLDSTELFPLVSLQVTLTLAGIAASIVKLISNSKTEEKRKKISQFVWLSEEYSKEVKF